MCHCRFRGFREARNARFGPGAPNAKPAQPLQLQHVTVHGSLRRVLALGNAAPPQIRMTATKRTHQPAMLGLTHAAGDATAAEGSAWIIGNTLSRWLSSSALRM